MRPSASASTSWSATWSDLRWRWRRHSCSASSATSSIWTARSSLPVTGRLRSAMTKDWHGAATRSGDRSTPQRRERRHERWPQLVWSAAGADHPVPDRNVGAVLLLRHARAARLLHDEAAHDRPADVVADLRHLHVDGVLHADHRRE